MNPQNTKPESADLPGATVRKGHIFFHEIEQIQNSLGDNDSPKFGKTNTDDGNLVEPNLIPVGPTLPPGKSMKFTTNIIMKTKLRIINQNVKLAAVSVNGIGHVVPEFKDFAPGTLDLTTAWGLGKAYIVKNQCDWILRIEYK